MNLEDKVVVVTGAAQGIGLACAERFVAEAARVVISDINAAGVEAAGLGATPVTPTAARRISTLCCAST